MKRSLIALTSITALISIAAVAQDAAAQLKYYQDTNGDKIYELVAVYTVTHQEALAAFAAAGGAPWDGTGSVLNAAGVPGVNLTGLHSWQGFVDFLNANYAAGLPESNQLCDNTINITAINWACGPPLDCNPNEDCRGLFIPVPQPNANWNCVAGGDPPCPSAKPSCVKNGNLPVVTAFDTIGGTACHCPGGVSGSCVVNPAAVPTGGGIMFTGDVCVCANPIPTLSEWGLIVLTLVLVTTGTILIRKQRRAAASSRPT